LRSIKFVADGTGGFEFSVAEAALRLRTVSRSHSKNVRDDGFALSWF
jgi:hypothetical protein